MQTMLSQFLEIEEKLIPDQFWDEISIFSRIVIPVSGGIDSTILVNEFLERGLKFELIWNDTRRSLQSARTTLALIFRYTGMPFFITYPRHPQKMITEKTREAMKKIVSGQIDYSKSAIPCCYYLKEFPMRSWIRDYTSTDTLIISGIAGYEGLQRQIRVGELRNANTFLRFKKTEKRWFAYPLRDYTNQLHGRKLEMFIQTTKFIGAVRSGCKTCPVVALFEEAIEDDMKRIEQSKKAWLPKEILVPTG